MFRNFTHTPSDLRDSISPMAAGITLLALPMVRLMYGSAHSMDAGFWVPFLSGALLVAWGAVLHVRRLDQIAMRAGGGDAS